MSGTPSRFARVASLPIAVALSISAAHADTHEAAPQVPTPEWDMIAFEVKSWGAPVIQWQYTPEYGGVWVKIERNMESDPVVWSKTYHSIDPDAERFAKLADAVARLPTPAPDSAECTDMMSDLPYGTIRLTRGATTTEIKWNSGCHDEGYTAFMAILKEADTMMSTWGKASTQTRTEETLIP